MSDGSENDYVTVQVTQVQRVVTTAMVKIRVADLLDEKPDVVWDALTLPDAEALVEAWQNENGWPEADWDGTVTDILDEGWHFDGGHLAWAGDPS